MSLGQDQKGPRPELPVDRGWAWFVMLGAAINTTFGYGFLRSLSIFFQEFLDKFQESATMTTLAFGLNTASFSVFAILVPLVFLPRFSGRTVSLVGASLNAFSIIALAFAPSIAYIYVMFIAIGAAGPMLYVSQVAMLGVYFKKRLSFAVAIANIGLCLATMGSPPLTRYLLDEYGLQGALLIQGGLSLHNIAASLLFRPPTLYAPNTISTDEGKTCDTTKEINSVQKQPLPIESVTKDNNKLNSTQDHENDNDLEKGPLLIVAEYKEEKRDSNDDQAMAKIDARKTKSLHDIHSTKSKPIFMDGTEFELDNKGLISRSHFSLTHHNMSSPLSKSRDVSKSSVFMDGNGITFSAFTDRHGQQEYDKSEFEVEATSTHSASSTSRSKWNLKQYAYCHPFGIMLLLVAGIGVNTQCATAYMPSLGKEQGLTDRQASLLMTVVGACDLCKLGYGFVADKGWVRRIYIVLVCQLILGVLFQFTSYFRGFVAMVILCAIFGAHIEANHCLLPGITVDLLGAEFIGQVMSGYFLTNGIVMSLTHLLIGFLKDETGSFIGGYQFMGGLYLLSAVIILLEPAFKALELRGQRTKDDSGDSRQVSEVMT